MGRQGGLLVGWDVGTAWVTAVVASLQEEGLEVVGVGTTQSGGLRKGVVVSIDPAAQAVARAIREAEVMAGCEIHSVFVGIGGGHIRGCNSHGVVAVRDREVATSDVTRVLDAARAVALPQEQRVVHVVPQQFVLDGQDGIAAPVGMKGVRLGAHVHVMTAAAPLIENVQRCCKRAGLHTANLILNPLASAAAVLGEEEKELGVALVDIGAGTTDVLVFHSGSVQHTGVLPVGGHHVTNDVAAGLRTSYRDAEILKRRSGCARAGDARPEEQVEVPGIGGGAIRVVPRRTLGDVIEARMEEIFTLAQQQIARRGLTARLACGIVLTGGGALLQGCAELAEKVFHLPVRLGTPFGVTGLPEATGNTELATAVGLVRLGILPHAGMCPVNGNGVVTRARQRMFGWLRGLM